MGSGGVYLILEVTINILIVEEMLGVTHYGFCLFYPHLYVYIFVEERSDKRAQMYGP
jgi:hypothetical protein